MSLLLAVALLKLRCTHNFTSARNEVAVSLMVSSLRANVGRKPAVILLPAS